MNKNLKIVLMTGAALVTPGQGYAQTASGAGAPAAANAPVAKSDTTRLETIVVSAQRSATNLQKTPVAVSAFSGATLTARGATTLRDVAGMTPSLTVLDRSGLGATQGGFNIRGIGVDAIQSSPGVGIYVDDVYYASRFGSILGLFDTERVEVLRGPQGTLFGRNTIAGAVQYITPKPSQHFTGYVTGTVGSQNHQDVTGVVNVPITNTLATRIALGSSNEGGYVRDLAADDKRGAEQLRQARVRVLWTPTSRLSVDLNGEIVNLRNNGRAGEITSVNSALGPNGGELTNAAFFCCRIGPIPQSYVSQSNYTTAGFNSPDFGRVDFKQISGTVTYDLSEDVKVKSTSAYATTRAENALDFDNTPLPIIAVYNGIDDTKLFTEELQLQGHSFRDRLKWTVGAYYFNNVENTNNATQTIATLPVMMAGNTSYTDEAESVFAQATYSFTNQWSLTAGVRQSYETYKGEITLPARPQVSNSFNNTSPTIGLNFQATKNVLLYIKASKGFRAGGVVVSPLLPAPYAVPFFPETAWTYEGGIRSTLFNDRLRLNLTGYYTDWKNIQFSYVNFSGAGPVPTVLNAGDAEIYGFEAESQLAVTRALRLYATLSTLHGEYTTILPAVSTLVNKDSTLARAPRLKVGLGGDYTYRMVDGSSFGLNLNYAWSDEQRSETSLLNSINIPSYGLLTGRIEYKSKSRVWGIDFYTNNITNKLYYIGGINLKTTTGTTFAEIGRPREYGVTLRVNF